MSNKSGTIIGGVGGVDGADPELTYEQLMALPPPPFRGRAKPKPKAILAEVSPRMHEAVKANPGSLRMTAKDEDGNAVIERPYRDPQPDPRNDPVGPSAALGEIKWGHGPFSSGIRKPNWGTGRGRGDDLVSRDYDIFKVLREDDR